MFRALPGYLSAGTRRLEASVTPRQMGTFSTLMSVKIWAEERESAKQRAFTPCFCAFCYPYFYAEIIQIMFVHVVMLYPEIITFTTKCIMENTWS